MNFLELFMSHLITIIVSVSGLLAALTFFAACVLLMIKGFHLSGVKRLCVVVLGFSLILVEGAFIQTVKDLEQRGADDAKREALKVIQKEFNEKKAVKAKLWV